MSRAGRDHRRVGAGAASPVCQPAVLGSSMAGRRPPVDTRTDDCGGCPRLDRGNPAGYAVAADWCLLSAPCLVTSLSRRQRD